MWDAADVTNDDKKIAQFAGALRKRALTWYMNFTENQARSKDKLLSLLQNRRCRTSSCLEIKRHQERTWRNSTGIRQKI